MDPYGICPSPLWMNIAIFLILLWTLPWKGIALWRAAGNKHRWWFIAIFLVNTLAIMEIIYIFGFSKKQETAT